MNHTGTYYCLIVARMPNNAYRDCLRIFRLSEGPYPPVLECMKRVPAWQCTVLITLISLNAISSPVIFMASFKGSGASLQDPVVIGDVVSHFEAVEAEYIFLHQTHGVKGRNWKLVRQTLIQDAGRYIDEMLVEVVGQGQRTYYFDITRYFGVFAESESADSPTTESTGPEEIEEPPETEEASDIPDIPGPSPSAPPADAEETEPPVNILHEPDDSGDVNVL